MDTIKWVIDPAHSQIGFKVKYLIFTNVSGNFKNFQALIESIDEQFETMNVSFEAEVRSIDTNSMDRDEHLLSIDFFDVEKYPKISFVSTNIRKINQNQFEMFGKITIRDITKSISIDMMASEFIKDTWGENIVGISLFGMINRRDFGLDWNRSLETGGFLVGEEIKLIADIQLTRL